MLVEIVKAEWQHIAPIAENLRDADILEIRLSSNKTPLQAVSEGFEQSIMVWTGMYGDVPIGMFGLCSLTILGNTGVPWLLGTDEMMKIRRQFLTDSKPYIDQMLSIHPRLVNFVHVDNSAGIRWLHWLGFDMQPPVKAGPYGALFHKFERLANV